MGKKSNADKRCRVRASRRRVADPGRIRLKDWATEKERLIEEIRRSERITAEDLAVIINARDH